MNLPKGDAPALHAASRSEVDVLLGKYDLIVPPEALSRPVLEQIAYAAKACLEQWAQGRGLPPRLTTEEIALRDWLGLRMEVFGD